MRGQSVVASTLVLWLALPGCNCGVVDETLPMGGASQGGASGDGGTPPAPDLCQIVDLTPAFGAIDVEVVNDGFEVTWNVDVDPASVPGAIRLLRLADGVEAPVTVTMIDSRTANVAAQGALRFSADYGLEIDGSVLAADGSTCVAQSTAFTTLRPEPTALAPRPAPASSVTLLGQYAVTASNTLPGLQVYDFTSPSAPELVASVPMGAPAQRVRVLDGRAYLPAGNFGVYIFDLTNPASPTLMGVAGTPGRASDVAPFVVDGKHYLAVADGALGIRILDVSVPEGPKDVAWRLFDGGEVTRVDIDGTRLLFTENGAFGVMDLSVPASPTLVTLHESQAVPETFSASRAIHDVAWLDGHIVLSLRHWGLQLFSFENDTPAFLQHWVGPNGTCTTICPDVLELEPGSPGSLAVSSLLSGVFTVSLSNEALVPSALQLVTPGVNGAAQANGRLFAATDAGLWIFSDSAAPGSPPIFAEDQGWGIVRGVALAHGDDRVFAASQGRGLITVSADPVNSTVLDVDATAGLERDIGGFDVGVEGSLVILADGRAGLTVFDAPDGGTPEQVSAVTGNYDTFSSVVLDGSVAYLCDGNQALRTFDMTNPSQPVELASININTEVSGCLSLIKVGSNLFVAGERALGTVDVTTPSSPVLTAVTTLPADEHFGGLAVTGDYLFATTFNSDWEAGIDGGARRLVVFDVSTPTAPVRVFKSEDAGVGGRLTIRGTKLFASAGSEGVHIYDIADPSNPTLEYTVELGADAYGITASSDALYVGARGAGVIPVYVGRTE
ncbi:MAG: Ig-like domain-containing protein [Polyangiaceae bacterium]